MILTHNRSHENSKVFTFEYLEPYQNGSCHSYSNCLLCLTDSLCGWCDLSRTCLLRHINESQVIPSLHTTENIISSVCNENIKTKPRDYWSYIYTFNSFVDLGKIGVT